MKKIVLAVLLCFAAGSAFAAENMLEVFGEGKLHGVFRTYYYDKDFDGDTNDQQDIATGGFLTYETGSFMGLSAGVEFKTSQDIGTEAGTGSRRLLTRDEDGNPEGYTALSQYYIKGNWFDTTVQFGAHQVDTPWLKSHDIHFSPKRYKGISLVNKSIPKLELHAHYLTEFIQWDSEEFQSFSSFKGIDDEDRGVAIGGIVWRAPGPWKIQLWDYHYMDMWNAPYLNILWRPSLTEDLGLIVDGRFYKQDDVGEALMGDMDTYMLAGSVAVTGYGATLAAEYSQIGDDRIQHGWGTHFKVLGLEESVEYAEEKGWAVRLDYDFGYLGAKGLTGYVYYLSMDTPDSGENANYDTTELDFQLQYKFPHEILNGMLDGWMLKYRQGIINRDAGYDDYTATRVYLQYTFDLPFKQK